LFKIKKKVATIWLSGVTASGKTTLGKLLYNELKNIGIEKVKFLDGETLRESLDKNYGHSLDERFKVLKEYINIVVKENKKGNLVIIATVSHKKEMRNLARKRLNNFMEVNLKCAFQICAERDYKGVYSNFDFDSEECLPGMTEPYEFTNLSELVIDTEKNSVEECKNILLNSVLKFLLEN